MNKDRDNILCEYSDEESAFVKGALSSSVQAEDASHFHMTLTAKEYILCDFSMYAESMDDPDMDPTDKYMSDRDPDQMTSEETFAKAFADSEKSPASEEYSMTSDAHLTILDNGRTLIRYNESLDGETQQICEVSFDTSVPGLVTICKSGMASTVMTIEEGKRHSCVYRTPFMDFEMRVRALRVDNKITENGGTLRMDYALEIRGAEAHRTVMEITLVKE